MSSLKNKVAVVTGGASGIGKATCMRFASEGSKLVIVDVSNSGIELARRLGKSTPTTFVKIDVTRPEQVRRMVNKVIGEFGRIDVLFCNAGVLGKQRALENLELGEWERILSVNLTGSFLCCKYSLPEMKKRRSGTIIMTSSTAGVVGSPYYSPYCASKGGVIQLTKALALEVAEYGIRVNCVCPGWVATGMTRNILARRAGRKNAVDSEPLGRVAEPKEIANAVAFLASEESSYMTGSVLAVDGGFTAR